MRALAAFIMRGRAPAVLVAAGSAAAAFLLPPLSWLSGAALALVTLRRGAVEGAVVVGAAGVATGLLTAFVFGTPAPAVSFAVVLWLPLWLLSLVLRATVSWTTTLEVAAALIAGQVLAFHLLVGGDTQSFWVEVLEATLGPMLRQMGVTDPGVALAETARLMTGLVAAATVLSQVACLVIARWWQAMLYNPGGFRREFHELRLSRRLAWAAVAAMLVAWLDSGPAGAVARDLLLLLLALQAVQGLAVVHGAAAIAGLGAPWLVLLYLLALVALPQVAVTLAGLGFADQWVDFRRRLRARRKSPGDDDSERE